MSDLKKIVIIDYGMGNLHSVKNALDYLGASSEVSCDSDKISSADALILPGVGAFPDAMKRLNELDLVKCIKKCAEEKPMLGICLGMQLLFDSSEEVCKTEGLGLISGDVIKLKAYADEKYSPKERRMYKIPHIGWNSLNIKKSDSPLMQGIENGAHVYFVHSFKADVKNPENLTASTEYGEEIAGIVENGNVFGAQFHPEKSEAVGLRILKNFIDLTKN